MSRTAGDLGGHDADFDDVLVCLLTGGLNFGPGGRAGRARPAREPDLGIQESNVTDELEPKQLLGILDTAIAQVANACHESLGLPSLNAYLGCARASDSRQGGFGHAG